MEDESGEIESGCIVSATILNHPSSIIHRL